MNNKLDKINPAGNKAQSTVTAEVKVEAPVQLELTHTALAIFRNKETQKFHLVEVKYNTEAANVNTVLVDVREDVIDRFKMLAADTFMGDL
jgi:hypothetical protein